MPVPTVASLSFCRGQSRQGIGEGPDRPISHGEQYLLAEGALYDVQFLDQARAWMSLDADPGDRLRLGENLEAWSCWESGGFLMVARLGAASVYDRRAAYFAHGRAWRVDQLPAGYDPGLHVGRSEAFETSWRNAAPLPAPPPALPRSEQIQAERDVAVQFLANLYRCRLENRPLIVAAPVAEFATRAPLHALLAFARGALPANLKRRCAVRVYTRTPDLFLRRLGADLVAVPEEEASAALGARRDATLLDRQGVLLTGEAPPDERFVRYAEAVVERAVRIPNGLGSFSQRFATHRAALGNSDAPDEDDLRSLQITYNLAVAFDGTESERGDLARNYLPRAAQKLGPEVPWKRLIAEDEWGRFPIETLFDLVLLDAEPSGDGARALQRSVEDALENRRESVDSRLADWWDPMDPAKLRRLLELWGHQSPLVSTLRVAERTTKLELRRIAESGRPDRALAAEKAAGFLPARTGQSGELGEIARRPGVFEILAQGVTEKILSLEWFFALINRANQDDLVEIGMRFLRLPFHESHSPWHPAASHLLDKLRNLDRVPERLATSAFSVGRQLKPEADLDTFLRLTDLVARQTGGGSTLPSDAVLLIQKLARELPRIENQQDRDFLLEVALDPTWRCPKPSDLVTQGHLLEPWIAEAADRLIQHEDLLAALAPLGLIELIPHIRDEASGERLFARLDAQIVENSTAVTAALLEKSIWPGWRRRSKLGIEGLAHAAQAWMTWPGWLQQGSEVPPLEDWDRALGDLPKFFQSDLSHALCGGEALTRRRLWPWIPPFEEDQLLELVDHCPDYGVMADFAEALKSDALFTEIGTTSTAKLLELASVSPELLDSKAFEWLVNGRGQVLTLGTSSLLLQKAGHRQDQARAARVSAVTYQLSTGNAQEALDAADNPSLWTDPGFLIPLADLISSWSTGVLPAEKLALADRVNRLLPDNIGRSSSREDAPYALCKSLSSHGLHRLVRFLSPTFVLRGSVEDLADEVLQALENHQGSAPCWARLGSLVEDRNGRSEYASEPHPFLQVVERYRRLPTERREGIARSDSGLLFERLASERPSWLDLDFSPANVGPQNPTLPGFALAAALAKEGALGHAVQRWIFLPENRRFRENDSWWQALLAVVHDQAQEGEQREDAALSGAAHHLSSFAGRERSAFWRCLQSDGARQLLGSFILSEFGIGREI